MANICKECADPSWSGQEPIVVPRLPVDGKVLEFDTFDDFPAEGESGFIYVDLENNDFYKWDTTGEQYVAIGGSSAERDYERLNNLPAVNGVTLIGDKSTADLGIADDINTAVAAEATARDTAIGTAIATEVSDRNTAIGTAIADEVIARDAAIAVEAGARAAADLGLQNQIDAITSASDVVDVVGTYAELQVYDTSKLHDNDIIKVLQDETHNDAITYYRWIVANEEFTYIGLQGPFYTKSETNVLLGDKQDVLTAGSNITISNNEISATDTTYTAGSNITISNNEISATDTTYTAGDNITISNNEISADVPELLTTTGQSEVAGMTQKAITEALANAGGVKVLTEADYNYPANNPVRVAAWLLDTGIYTTGNLSDDSIWLKNQSDTSDVPKNANGTSIIIVNKKSDSVRHILTISKRWDDTDTYAGFEYTANLGGNTGPVSKILTEHSIVDALNSTKTDKALSANQGKVLNERIGDTTSLVTTDKSNLVAAVNEVAAGGGGDKVYSTVQTSDSNYGGSVWIGPLNASQEPIPDPSTSDAHLRYAYINPTNSGNYNKPASGVVNILGSANGVRQIVIGAEAGGGSYGSYDSVLIGYSANTTNSVHHAVVIGTDARSARDYGLALGAHSHIGWGAGYYSVALGAYSTADVQGELSIGGSDLGTNGYNNTSYRKITNVYDGENAHDALTVGQANALIDAINSAMNTSIPHIGAGA